ncbi:MAG TPA: sulfotransferase [Anaerolineales bacterium]
MNVFKKVFASRPSRTPRTQTVIVVSGLPRSGTSMMMKMLAEGGLPVLSDSVRRADEDNPNGYFELEAVKQLSEGQKDWLAGADHKIVKVISALLEHLPPEHHYKVLFMERQIPEILASQRKMLARRNETSHVSDEEMEAQFRQHLKVIKYWLARQPNMDVLYVDYNRMMADPDPSLQKVIDFLGLPLDVSKMRAVPNEGLYRNRT